MGVRTFSRRWIGPGPDGRPRPRAAYALPTHLRDIVDPASGEVNQGELEKSLEALRPHANL